MSSRVASQMQGKGFEFAVASEMLLQGFNCTPTVVDAGIDIFALSNSGRQIKIQVKGRNFKGHGTGVESVNFSKKSYVDPATSPDIIVIVLRNFTRNRRGRPMNSFLIMTKKEVDNLLSDGYVEDLGDNLKLNMWAEFGRDGKASRVVIQKSYGKKRTGKDLSASLEAWHIVNVALT